MDKKIPNDLQIDVTREFTADKDKPFVDGLIVGGGMGAFYGSVFDMNPDFIRILLARSNAFDKLLDALNMTTDMLGEAAEVHVWGGDEDSEDRKDCGYEAAVRDNQALVAAIEATMEAGQGEEA